VNPGCANVQVVAAPVLDEAGEAAAALFGGGLVLVSHDRYLLDRVTTRMLELDRGAAGGGFVRRHGKSGKQVESRA